MLHLGQGGFPSGRSVLLFRPPPLAFLFAVLALRSQHSFLMGGHVVCGPAGTGGIIEPIFRRADKQTCTRLPGTGRDFIF